MKKFVFLVISIALIFSMAKPVIAISKTGFADVPIDSWAEEYILKAKGLKIVNGYQNGNFGYGDNVKRGEFAAMLCNYFNWEQTALTAQTFYDVSPTDWFFNYVETATAMQLQYEQLGATKVGMGGAFRPNDAITRGEMAVMIVDSLGFETVSNYMDMSISVFTDLTNNVGAITMAYDFGIIKGTSPSKFDPNGFATREQAATMIVNLYNRTHVENTFKTSFYAISSFAQMNYISEFDSVCFGWGRMEMDAEKVVYVNTTSKNNNDWRIPSEFETPLSHAKDSGKKAILAIYMDQSQKFLAKDGSNKPISHAIFTDERKRTQAIDVIVTECNLENRFDGVCIDFEGLKGDENKAGFNKFLAELNAKLDLSGKLLYATVPPALPNGQEYFNGYDYHTIGEICDKTILMAYDYEATSMTTAEMNMGFAFTPLTPMENVYYSIKAITDKNSGVSDTSKIVFGLSFDSVLWEMKDGKVINSKPFHPTYDRILYRLQQGSTEAKYNARYRNPYAVFVDETNGTTNILWYEDERSIEEKILLAKLLGINGVSVWRLGTIPSFENKTDEELYLNVWDTISK